ncbi:hypothetical protein [Streptomyces sp. NPDC050528]|uniref:hypothetical protein n=1 Tax=unclassified Streptomyces TaxID=2593676 RepID=UPI00378EEDBD
MIPSTVTTYDPPLGTSGWNQYEVLTSSGDITGDGKGSFEARVKIATGWGGYKSLS